MISVELKPCDILLFRKRTWIGKLISYFSGSDYCHAAMVDWNTSYLIEIAPIGFRRLRLITDYDNEPIDVYRYQSRTPDIFPRDPCFAMDVTDNMSQIAGRYAYSYFDLLRVGLRCITPDSFLWLWGSKEPTTRFHCSGAISAAFRMAGVDLCPNVSDWQTTPGHLAASESLHKVSE
jgi:hypothetical protein